MKILIYSKAFLPATGGIQTVVSELARGLANGSRLVDGQKIEVTVVTQTLAKPDEHVPTPFRVVRSPTLLELVSLIRNSDIIHIAGATILPMFLAFASGKPMVVEHHGFQAACPNGLLFYEPDETPCPGHYMAGSYHKCIECNRGKAGSVKSARMLVSTPLRRWLLNRAKTNIMPTDWLATVLKLQRMKTLHHGIPIEPVHPPRARSVPVTFAFQGRLVSTKGAKVLLRAAEVILAENKEFQILIVGDGPEREFLKSHMSEALSRRVKFLGRVDGNKLNDALKDAAVFVMPSLAGEVFGLVAAENMMRGKLPIISNIGALREVVGETGWVFQTGNADDLAMCMERAIKEPDLVESLSASARTRAMQTFGVDSMIERHLSVYRGALAR